MRSLVCCFPGMKVQMTKVAAARWDAWFGKQAKPCCSMEQG